MPRFVRYLESEADANGYPNLGATLTVDDESMTGLTNGVAYRVALLVPGPTGTPEAAAALVTPVHLASAASGTNTAVASFVATKPTYSAGDLVVVQVNIDGGLGIIAGITATLAGETIFTEVTPFDNNYDNQNGHTIALFSFIAAAASGSSGDLTISLDSGSDNNQISAIVSAWDAGTTKTSTPRLGNKTQYGTGSTAVTTVPTGTFTAASAQAKIVTFVCMAADNPTGVPADWTLLASTDPGAAPVWAITRDAATTASESVASVNIPTLSRTGTAITYTVLPAGS